MKKLILCILLLFLAPNLWATGIITKKGFFSDDEGKMIQHIKTDVLDIKIKFIRLTNPSERPYFIELIEKGQRILYVDLAHGRYIYRVSCTTSDMGKEVGLLFTEEITTRYRRPWNSFNWAWVMCYADYSAPNMIKVKKELKAMAESGVEFRGTYLPKIKKYQILKPQIKEKFKFNKKSYTNLKIDLSKEKFCNKHQSPKRNIIGIHRRFLSEAEKRGEPEYYTDEDGDGIIDIFKMAERGNTPDNHTISDYFQTKHYYIISKIYNFMDFDRDGICDNYRNFIFRKKEKVAIYPHITIDMTQDFFQNKEVYLKKWRHIDRHNQIDWMESAWEPVDWEQQYIDENDDGIADRFQNSTFFHEIYGKVKRVVNSHSKVISPRKQKVTYTDYKNNVIKYGAHPKTNFIDKNNDTIHDSFQTAKFYYSMGLLNFVDIDGDGLCDNYIK